MCVTKLCIVCAPSMTKTLPVHDHARFALMGIGSPPNYRGRESHMHFWASLLQLVLLLSWAFLVFKRDRPISAYHWEQASVNKILAGRDVSTEDGAHPRVLFTRILLSSVSISYHSLDTRRATTITTERGQGARLAVSVSKWRSCGQEG